MNVCSVYRADGVTMIVAGAFVRRTAHHLPGRNRSRMAWLAVWGLAVVLNVVPAFMPPTWAVLAYFHLYHGLPTLPLALVGALGATTGRALLALGSRAFGVRFLPPRWRANIEELVKALRERPTLAISSLALFGLGPLPSNQLFIAAGIARAPLLPILLVFGVARCISYILWISAANVADRSLEELIGPHFGSWGVIAMQLAGFALILLVMRVDWRSVLRSRPPADHGGEELPRVNCDNTP